MRALRLLAVGFLLVVSVVACRSISTSGTPQNPAVRDYESDFGDAISQAAARLRDQGQEVFRRETFGDEAFWGGQLRLHEAIAGEKRGVSAPVSPRGMRWRRVSRSTSTSFPRSWPRPSVADPSAWTKKRRPSSC
jgi:hypothetical protein